MAREASPVRWIRIRIAALAVVLLGSFAGLLVRAARLQLGEGTRLAGLAREQYLSKIDLPARRGSIRDRHGIALASSVQVDSIFGNPEQLADADLTPLATTLRLGPAALSKKLSAGGQFVWIDRQVSAAQADAVRKLALPGVGFAHESRRFYPERELAAQLLGFTGIDGEGLEGLERRYDGELHGQDALVAATRDARGRLIAEASVADRELEGASIQLTIDRDVQYLAQQALDRGVASSGSVAGIALALDPATGEILALAVSPSFNPNAVGGRDRNALRDRAITDAYEPGSTFKAFVAAAALQEKVVTPASPLFCENGAWAVNGRTIHDHRPFGWMSLGKVLQVSSNIGAAKVGLALGRERLHEYLNAFGFGERTDVGLPGEVRGTIGPFRSDIATATASFGQGVTATPLQIVTAYAALANRGTLLRPYVVKEISRPDGQRLQFDPHPVRRVVSPAVADAVTRMLETVVSKAGTAASAALPGYDVAGKTGTAQKVDPVSGGYSPDKRLASFVGYAPAGAARLVVGVFLDEPKGEIYGGEIAAPVFREIAQGALRQLGVAPDHPVAAGLAQGSDPVGAGGPVTAGSARLQSSKVAPLPPIDPAVVDDEVAASRGPSVPSVVGLPARGAVRALAAAGLTASLAGEGRVVSQRPAAGGAPPRDGAVRLTLADPSRGQP